MTTTIDSAGLHQNLHQKVALSGWVRSRRLSKAGLVFIDLYDGITPLVVQLISTAASFDTLCHVCAGTALSVVGEVVLGEVSGQPEIMVSDVTFIGAIDHPKHYPITPKHHTAEWLRTVPHLRIRTQICRAVMRMRSYMAHIMHQFFNMHDFAWVHTPILTTSDCEGAGELFEVNHRGLFDRSLYLTVSGQLHLETYCAGLSRVYTFGPTFRAENSNTHRHLAEFWMVEPEIAFCDFATLCDWIMRLVKEVVTRALEQPWCATLRSANPQMALYWSDQWRDMTYTQAITVLSHASQPFQVQPVWGIDLTTEHERFLCEHYTKGPLMIAHYPTQLKPFYMRQNDDGQTVAAVDVLLPGIGEVIGGSQREERLSHLTTAMTHAGVDQTAYNWYLDLRRFGTTPHAGFGLGFDRLVQYVTGMSNIRDVVAFPRTPGTLHD
jgi:asparaginyl-tRNA synthetase